MQNFEHFLNFINQDKMPKLTKITKKGIEAEDNYEREHFNTAIMLCRQVVEEIIKLIAEEHNISLRKKSQETKSLVEITNELVDKMSWGEYYKNKLHNIRLLGNDAIHDIENNDPKDAFNAIRDAYNVFDILYKLRYAPKNFQDKTFFLKDKRQKTNQSKILNVQNKKPQPEKLKIKTPTSKIINKNHNNNSTKQKNNTKIIGIKIREMFSNDKNDSFINQICEVSTISDIDIKVGDSIRKNQPIISLEADKVVFEGTSPINGVVHHIFIQKGDQVKSDTIAIQILKA